jgi:hypothetical protein
MKVAWTEITRSNRKVKENAHTPAVLRGCGPLGRCQLSRADRVVLCSDDDLFVLGHPIGQFDRVMRLLGLGASELRNGKP